METKIFNIKNKFEIKKFKKFYNNFGYLILRGVFKKKETVKLDNSICQFADDDWHNIMNPDRLEFLLSQSHKKFFSIKNQNERIKFVEKAEETSKLFRSYLLDKRILKLMKKVIGREVNGLMTHVIFKNKGSKYAKMSWLPHQDNSYAKMKKESYITANLFIHKASKENGGLYLYPGSHKNWLLKSEKNFSYWAKYDQRPGNEVKSKNYKNSIDLNVKEGDFLIMNGNLIHGSYPNKSKKNSRHLLSFNYGVVGEKFFPGATAQRKRIY